MKGTKVLDAYSIIAYLEKDGGYEKMIHYFQEAVEANRNLLLSVVNWGEVYYIVLREYGKNSSTTSTGFLFFSLFPH